MGDSKKLRVYVNALSIPSSESMATSMEKESAFERFKEKLGERITQTYGNMVQIINESLTRMLQSTISNAEQLEEFAKNELTNLADIVFRSKIVNKESQKFKAGVEYRMANHSEGQDAFENDAGHSFSMPNQQIKMENEASGENGKNVERAVPRFQCQECSYSSN